MVVALRQILSLFKQVPRSARMGEANADVTRSDLTLYKDALFWEGICCGRRRHRARRFTAEGPELVEWAGLLSPVPPSRDETLPPVRSPHGKHPGGDARAVGASTSFSLPVDRGWRIPRLPALYAPTPFYSAFFAFSAVNYFSLPSQTRWVRLGMLNNMPYSLGFL